MLVVCKLRGNAQATKSTLYTAQCSGVCLFTHKVVQPSLLPNLGMFSETPYPSAASALPPLSLATLSSLCGGAHAGHLTQTGPAIRGRGVRLPPPGILFSGVAHVGSTGQCSLLSRGRRTAPCVDSPCSKGPHAGCSCHTECPVSSLRSHLHTFHLCSCHQRGRRVHTLPAGLEAAPSHAVARDAALNHRAVTETTPIPAEGICNDS